MLGNLFNKKTKHVIINSPLTGNVMSLEHVPDEAFSGKYMGDGVAIEPLEGILAAPFDGVVAHLIDTCHAVIVEHPSGLQLLMHIGVNTVNLQGKGFTAKVRSGDPITAGQTLIEFDLEQIREAGYPVITPVVIANMELVTDVKYRYKPFHRKEENLLSVVLKKLT